MIAAISNRSTTSIFLVVVLLALSLLLYRPNHPYTGLNVEQLIKAYGYNSETHKVQTEDGYILTLFRIPHGKNTTNTTFRKPPVILTHGFLNSAADYVCIGPQKSLAFLLAENNYDVWLANSRGTTWSKEHVHFDPNKDAAYWNFTMHEIGVFDIPAIIDYVLNTTNFESLHYIAYSQGTVAYSIALSERPEYVKKIKFLTGLAPIVYVKNFQSPLVRLIVSVRKLLQALEKVTNINEISSTESYLAMYIRFFCNGNSLLMPICLKTFYFLQGNTDNFDMSFIPVFATNMPAGFAAKQGLHLLQMMEIGELQKFDYNKETNLKVYNQSTPILYDVSKVTTPIAFYHSEYDWIAGKNLERYASSFPNIVRNEVIRAENFGHMDYLLRKDVAELLYKPVIEEMSKYL